MLGSKAAFISPSSLKFSVSFFYFFFFFLMSKRGHCRWTSPDWHQASGFELWPHRLQTSWWQNALFCENRVPISAAWAEVTHGLQPMSALSAYRLRLLFPSHLTQLECQCRTFEHGSLVCVVMTHPQTTKLQDKQGICLCSCRSSSQYASWFSCVRHHSASISSHFGYFLFIFTWEPPELSHRNRGYVWH